MYDGIQAYGGIKGLGAVALIYFLFLFIAGLAMGESIIRESRNI